MLLEAIFGTTEWEKSWVYQAQYQLFELVMETLVACGKYDNITPKANITNDIQEVH